jgi:hypothetical protein
MGTLIEGTPFSIQYVLEKMGQNQKDKQINEETPKLHVDDLISYEAKEIDITAFMSSIYRVKLNWKDPCAEPKSVILKIPGPKPMKIFDTSKTIDTEEQDGVTEDMLEINDFLHYAHSREIAFYDFFCNLQHPSLKLKLPKFYYGYEYNLKHRDGIIIMEDLTPRATTVPVLPGFDNHQIMAVIDELAKLQSMAWMHPEWKERVQTRALYPGFVDVMVQMTMKLKKINPGMFNKLLDELMPLFTVERCEGSCYVGEKFGFPASIVHSDLWAPNLLWEKDANGNASSQLSAIIDWQTVHTGNPCEDILRLLSLNTSVDYRRQNTERLLCFFVERIEYYMNIQGRSVPFTLEQIKCAYKESMPFALLYLGFGAPMYYEMDSVVGAEAEGERRQNNQMELLSRVEAFFEDTRKAFSSTD